MEHCCGHVGHFTNTKAGAATGVLRHEHDVILQALIVLERAGKRLAAGKDVDPVALKDLADLLKTFADMCHHSKEEQHLFPALERKGIPREGGPIGVMLREHEEGRGYLRTFSGSGPTEERAEAAGQYVQFLRAHIDKENGILFPMADQVLSSQEQESLSHLFEEVEHHIVGPGIHEKLMASLEGLEEAIPA